MRALGIPTVVDRFIQHAILQVLTPLYAPTCSGSSYGFRPNKSAHQALAAGRAAGSPALTRARPNAKLTHLGFHSLHDRYQALAAG
jgi:hypothetical protein